MTRKRSLALTILVVLILALELYGVIVDKQPVDPDNHTIGDSFFLLLYPFMLLPAAIGFLCGVFEVVDRPVFEGKKGVLRVILAYLRLTLALIFNLAFWAAYSGSLTSIPYIIEHFLKLGLPGAIIIFTITFVIGSAAFPGKPRDEIEITPEIKARRKKQLIAFVANVAVFIALGILSELSRGTEFRQILSEYTTNLIISPVILGISWGVFENIAHPVLSRKNGVLGIVLPFVRAAIVQWITLFGHDLIYTVNLYGFPIGSFIFVTAVGLAAFLITCAVFACPPDFVKRRPESARTEEEK